MADHPDNNTAGTASFDRARRNVTIPWYRELRWGDWLLYLLIAGLAVGLMTGLIGPVRQRAVRAVLSDSGRTIAQFDLSAETESGSKAIDAHGHHYVLEWEEGRIRFAEADFRTFHRHEPAGAKNANFEGGCLIHNPDLNGPVERVWRPCAHGINRGFAR